MDIPSIDTRSYKHLVLPANGLQVLLIHDADTDKAAASMSVRVGQMGDPMNFPGLAHLTEHLLMMGSEKFPQENSYDAFLSQVGGHNNAYTDLELTVYYFDCQAASLESALDRFGSCFSSPLLASTSVGREISAVDSEHAKNVQSDSWRLHQLTRTLLGKSCAQGIHIHPYGSFGTGNKESLGAHDIDTLSQAVRAFYEEYYSATNMTLCVVGKESLEALEVLVTTYFSDISAQGKTTTTTTTTTSSSVTSIPFAPQLPKRVHVVPITPNVTTLELQWPMRETKSLYQCKPTRFLSHLLGHEGPGSLLSVLRDLHWAQELYSDDGSKSCHDFCIFTMQIELTDLGLTNVNTIVRMAYAYLELLLQKKQHDNTGGIPDWVFDELKATSDIQFRFLSKRAPCDTASAGCVQMQHYAPEHFLSGPYLLFTKKMPSAEIQDCLSYLNPDNMLLLVSSKEFEDTTDQTDPWYGTQYSEMEIDPELLEEWRHPTKTTTTTTIDDGGDDDISKAMAGLRLPDPNDMLATNFDLVQPHAAFSSTAPAAPAAAPAAGTSDADDGDTNNIAAIPPPRCLVDTPTCRLWYKPDTVFGQPKVNAMILLRTCTAYVTSPVDSVLASLWVELLQEHCMDFSYAASMAGLHCDFQNSRMGMEIHVSGYNHKAGILLQRITEAARTMVNETFLTKEIFERIVDKLRNQFSAFMVAQPYQHAIYAVDLCVEEQKWNMQDRMACLDDIEPGDLIHFSKTLLSRFSMELLVHGNVSANEAIEFSQQIQTAWKVQAPYHLPVLRVAHLASDNCVYRFRGWNQDDNNNCVLNLFQIGPVDVSTNAAMSVLQHLMREPAFNQLRTEEQLGYIVHTSIKTSGSTIKGWLCLIQSDSFDPIHMDERIEAFLIKMRSLLVELSKEDFETNVQSVCQNLLEKDKNLGEESNKYWGVITNQTYRFRRLQEIAAKAKELNKEDILRLFDKYLLAKSPYRRKLSVLVFGKNHADLLEQVNSGQAASSTSSSTTPAPLVIEDPKRFCQSQPLFPVDPVRCIDDLKLTID